MLHELAMISAEAGATWEALVAHQLRAPLAALVQKFNGAEELSADDVTPELQRMLRLVEQLQISGTCTPEAMETCAPFDLDDMTRSSAEMLVPLALANGQVLSVRSHKSRSYRALGKASLVAEAIANLVGNAIKYAPAKTRIDLVTLGGTDLCVMDRGPGLSEQDAMRVFQPFVRGSDVKKDDGSGLGLYLVRRIADLNHGWVTYTARKGGGAVFRLHLPPA